MSKYAIEVKSENHGDLRISNEDDLFYCRYGFRHKDGMTFNQAIVWNTGTCRIAVKGEISSSDPVRMRVPMQCTGADQVCSSNEVSVMEMEQRGSVMQFENL